MTNTPYTNTKGEPKKYFTSINSYIAFIEKNPEYKDKNGKYFISQSTYAAICRDFNLLVSDQILQGEEFKIPGRMGSIRIVKSKVNLFGKIGYDYGHYNKTGDKIVHLNEHSDGYYSRWGWSKKNCYVSHKSFYCFIPSRENKSKLVQIMKKPKGHRIYQTYF